MDYLILPDSGISLRKDVKIDEILFYRHVVVPPWRIVLSTRHRNDVLLEYVLENWTDSSADCL